MQQIQMVEVHQVCIITENMKCQVLHSIMQIHLGNCQQGLQQKKEIQNRKIKGWKKYLEWNKPSEKGIQKQAEYNLKGKLETSKEICVAISGQSNIFSQIPEVFILVTDIDVSEQGVENFHFNMMALATTSSVWESKCNTELNSQLEQQITTIPKYYVTCKRLEDTLSTISTR